jgi:hypothetical protein
MCNCGMIAAEKFMRYRTTETTPAEGPRGTPWQTIVFISLDMESSSFSRWSCTTPTTRVITKRPYFSYFRAFTFWRWHASRKLNVLTHAVQHYKLIFFSKKPCKGEIVRKKKIFHGLYNLLYKQQLRQLPTTGHIRWLTHILNSWHID